MSDTPALRIEAAPRPDGGWIMTLKRAAFLAEADVVFLVARLEGQEPADPASSIVFASRNRSSARNFGRRAVGVR